jgi:hypothetical protein
MPDKKLTDDQRRDAVLARMLATRPKPFTPTAAERAAAAAKRKAK